MKLTIDVTQEDIDLGCKVDTTGVKGGCMVWRAFNRCTEGSFPYFRVNYEEIFIYQNLEEMGSDVTYSQIIDLPEELKDKIRDFDHGFPVQPFSFEVDIPVEAVR